MTLALVRWKRNGFVSNKEAVVRDKQDDDDDDAGHDVVLWRMDDSNDDIEVEWKNNMKMYL